MNRGSTRSHGDKEAECGEPEMARIYCLCCGNLIDSHSTRCERCRRCPACGSKVADAQNRCPQCEHPSDETAVASMEQRLDPELPSSQQEIRRLAAAWERDEAARRITAPKLALLSLLIVLPLQGILVIASAAAGLRSWWSALVGLLLMVFVLRAVCDQVRRGRMQWLLKTGEAQGVRR